LQAFHGIDIIGLFGIAQRSPATIYFREESEMIRTEKEFTIHVVGVKSGNHWLKSLQRTREKTLRRYWQQTVSPGRMSKAEPSLRRNRTEVVG
jgi:hypothetical protein